MRPAKPQTHDWVTRLAILALTFAAVLTGLLSLFPARSFDIWWHALLRHLVAPENRTAHRRRGPNPRHGSLHLHGHRAHLDHARVAGGTALLRAPPPGRHRHPGALQGVSCGARGVLGGPGGLDRNASPRTPTGRRPGSPPGRTPHLSPRVRAPAHAHRRPSRDHARSPAPGERDGQAALALGLAPALRGVGQSALRIRAGPGAHRHLLAGGVALPSVRGRGRIARPSRARTLWSADPGGGGDTAQSSPHRSAALSREAHDTPRGAREHHGVAQHLPSGLRGRVILEGPGRGGGHHAVPGRRPAASPAMGPPASGDRLLGPRPRIAAQRFRSWR
jgi:hypothetical protein